MCKNSGNDLSQPTSSWARTSLALGILLLFSILLRLFRIDNQSLWVDELLTLGQSAIGRSWAELYLLDNIHGPLQSVLMHIVGFFGRSELLFRVPSAIFGALTVAGMFWIGRTIADDKTGFLAGYFCAVSPLGVWYSQEARNYSMCLFFTVLALGLFLLFIRRGQTRHLLGYAVTLALSLLSNLTAVFVAVATQTLSIFTGASKWRFWKVAAVHVAVALLFIPWILQAWGEWIEPRLETADAAVPLRGETTFTAMAVPFAIYTFSAGFTLGPSLSELHVDRSSSLLGSYWMEIAASVIVFGFLFIRGAMSLFSRSRQHFWVLAVWFAMPILLVSVLGVLNIKPFNVRYILVGLPVYLILLACGAAGLRRSIMAVSVIAVTLLSVLSLSNLYFCEKYWKEDTRGAARYISERTSPDSRIMAYSIVALLRWYLPDRTIVQIHQAKTGTDEEVIETLRRETADVSEFWLVTSRDWAADPSRRVRRLVGEMFSEEEARDFVGVEVSKHSTRRELRY